MKQIAGRPLQIRANLHSLVCFIHPSIVCGVYSKVTLRDFSPKQPGGEHNLPTSFFANTSRHRSGGVRSHKQTTRLIELACVASRQRGTRVIKQMFSLNAVFLLKLCKRRFILFLLCFWRCDLHLVVNVLPPLLGPVTLTDLSLHLFSELRTCLDRSGASNVTLFGVFLFCFFVLFAPRSDVAARKKKKCVGFQGLALN